MSDNFGEMVKPLALKGSHFELQIDKNNSDFYEWKFWVVAEIEGFDMFLRSEIV